jgi:hypothetical protein
MLGAIHPLASELPASSENTYHPRHSGFIWGIPTNARFDRDTSEAKGAWI